MAAMKALAMAVAMIGGQASDQNLPPRRTDANQLVIATSSQLAPLLRRTAIELQRQQPRLKISILSVGSDVAMAELYTRKADLAIIGRSATDPEVKAFQWIYQYPPQRWTLLRGSRAKAGHSPSVRLLVNVSNPIRQLTVEQLNNVFRRTDPLRWASVGVKGPFGIRPIHPIIPDTEQGTGRFIRDALFGGSTLFAWERVREFTEASHRGGIEDRVGMRIAEAVAKDPDALAFLPGNPVPGTRAVPLICSQNESPRQCDGKGALERSIYAYSDRALQPGARDFLRLLTGISNGSRIDLAPYRRLRGDEAKELRSELR